MSVLVKAINAYYALRIRRLKRQTARELALHRKTIERLENEAEIAHNQVLEKRLTLIGSIIHVWSSVESRINLTVGMVHACSGAYKRREPLPRSLDKKLDYLKDASSWKPLLSLCTEIEAFLTVAHQEKTFRHNLVHGEYHVNDFESEYAFDFHLLKVRGHESSRINTQYTHEQLWERSQAVARLSQLSKSMFDSVYETLVKLVEGAG